MKYLDVEVTLQEALVFSGFCMTRNSLQGALFMLEQAASVAPENLALKDVVDVEDRRTAREVIEDAIKDLSILEKVLQIAASTSLELHGVDLGAKHDLV